MREATAKSCSDEKPLMKCDKNVKQNVGDAASLPGKKEKME